MGNGFQIGKVARETGLTVDAVRYYERQRLLQPAPRTEGGYRVFSQRDIEDIRFIGRAQQLGFSLDEIRELMLLQAEQGATCSHVRDLVQAKLTAVRHKMAALSTLENELTLRLSSCEDTLRTTCGERCPVLEEIGHSKK